MLTLAGVNDENLIELARQTGAKIALRGETLAVSGNAESVARAIPIAQRMIDTAKQQMPLTADDVRTWQLPQPSTLSRASASVGLCSRAQRSKPEKVSDSSPVTCSRRSILTCVRFMMRSRT